ncbi:nucleolar protein dao-5-like isoform X3 [Mastacembelus armatus]|uniref:nucleolar protein dao-5-like isoform X3 n=1 Tax=Mastacembelus armatus TaxID=205130 RepID=UPI000E45D22D|nr:nucleolar protein dao-5-like isoform X3 [Mastacembelus armatus]
MKSDRATDNGVEDSGHGDSSAADNASGERRASIVTLQSVLKKVSPSPFHNYKTLVSSSSDSSGSFVNESQNAQNGVNGDLTRTNSLYEYALASGKNGHVMMNGGKETSEDVDLKAIFVPVPEFQSSPLDRHLKIKTIANSNEICEPQNHIQDPFQTSAVSTNTSANGYSFHDVTLNSPDLFRANPDKAQNPSKTLKSKDSDLFQGEVGDLFQTPKGEVLSSAATANKGNLFDKSPSVFVDPFISPSDKKDDVFWSPQLTVSNPFYTATNGEADLFQATHFKENKSDSSTMFSKEILGVFSSSSTNAVNPFPCPLKRDLFHELSSLDDPFGTTPSKQYDPFQDVSNGTPDFVQPLSSVSKSEDIFAVTPKNAASKGSYAKLPLNSPSEVKLDMLSPQDLFSPVPSESLQAVQPESFHRPQDIVLTTPEGTKHDILEPCPFSRSRNLAMPHSHSPAGLSHVLTIRRPPKPLPRTRPPKPESSSPSPGSSSPRLGSSSPKPGSKPGSSSPKPGSSSPKLGSKPRLSSPKPETSPKPWSSSPRPGTSPKPETSPRPGMSPKPGMSPSPAKPIGLQPAVLKTSPKPALRKLPKPLFGYKSKTPESKPVDADDYVVFEDILLLGQEMCVEDWPEDSPELSPGFKPAGKLRLRRESLMGKADSDGGSGEEQDLSGSQSKKKERRLSLLSRRGSKDKFPDNTKDRKSQTQPTVRKSSKEYSETYMSGENEDGEQNGIDYKKKTQKHRRASIATSEPEAKHMNGHLHEDGTSKKSGKKNSITRQWSEGTVLDDITGEDEDEEEEEVEGEPTHGEKRRKKKLKIGFVPHRGFAITLETTDDRLKGAHGYTPHKGSKELQDGVLGAHGYTLSKMSQDYPLDGVEEIKASNLQSTSKAAFQDDEQWLKTQHCSPELNGDHLNGVEDCKPKKPAKLKLLQSHRSSKEDLNYTTPQKKSSFSAELDDEELNKMEDIKQNRKLKGLVSRKHKSKTIYSPAERSEAVGFSQHLPQSSPNDALADDEIKGKYFLSPGEMYESEDDEVKTCKPKKSSKLKGFKHKAKSKTTHLDYEEPPGATSSDYLSDAAKAEWLAAQKDEQAVAGLKDEDEEGDTDSLMEWWYTVEQWDEVPSDDEDKILKEDESKSFTILADKVHRGLRVFIKVFTERAEVLWQSIIVLHAIADDISNFHQKTKIAGITGGTTTAVGGVTAVTGLALAPFTFAASLIITAVGVGVAAAGGITSASAAISDNVNNMHDRKKVEEVLQEYENHLLDIAKILHFVNQGLYKLRGHPFLRSGTQHYSEDWEIRRAVQMISIVDSPVMRGTEIADGAVASVQRLFKGMDTYFVKDSRELKKGCKKEMVAEVKQVANVLSDMVVGLNTIREELQEAIGEV